MIHIKVLAPVLIWLALALMGCAANAAIDSRSTQPPAPTPAQSVSNAVLSPPTPVPIAVVTATPLSLPQRPVYVIDSNDGERISRILVIDPDNGRHVSSYSTRYIPDLAFSPDGQRMYIADTYWTQVTHGEKREVLSVRDTISRQLLVDDLPIPHRALYKVYPPGRPNLFLSDNGRHLFSMRYGNPDPHQSRLAILDAEDLEVLHEGPAPPCGHRIQAQSDQWLCANTIFPNKVPSGQDVRFSISIDMVDPWTGTKLETLLIVEDLKGGLSGLASTHNGNRLYLVDREAGVTTIDIPNQKVVEQANLDMPEKPQLIIEAVATTPDGLRLFLGVATGEARDRALVNEIWVYDTETREPLTRMQMRDPVMHFAFSAAGDHLYAVSPVGHSFTIYNADSYQEIATFDDLGGSPARVVVPGAGG
jgi:hypothetical protein